MRERPTDPAWPGRPDTGEIDIDGERWRWVTVGQVSGSRVIGRDGIAWSIRFRCVERPEDSFWYDLPAPSRQPEPRPDDLLRNAFREARSASG